MHIIRRDLEFLDMYRRAVHEAVAKVSTYMTKACGLPNNLVLSALRVVLEIPR